MILDGVLVVDKTEGPTSHDVVTLARRALGVSRIGHTGTLDPMATGVLPLVIGRATRLAQFLTASDKTYEATIAFGRTTDTYDASGKVVTTSDRRPTRDAARRGAGAVPRHVRADAAGLFREEHRRRALVRPRAQGARPAVAHAAQGRHGHGASGSRSWRSTATRRGSRCRSRPASTCARSRTTSATRSDAARVLAALRRTRSGEFGLERAVPLADVLQSRREIAGRRGWSRFGELLPDLPAVTLRRPANLERLKNGVEMGPGDLVAPLAAPAAAGPAARPGGGSGGPGKAGQNAGFLHGWVVLGSPEVLAGCKTGFWSNIIRLQAMLISPYTAAWWSSEWIADYSAVRGGSTWH